MRSHHEQSSVIQSSQYTCHTIYNHQSCVVAKLEESVGFRFRLTSRLHAKRRLHCRGQIGHLSCTIDRLPKRNDKATALAAVGRNHFSNYRRISSSSSSSSMLPRDLLQALLAERALDGIVPPLPRGGAQVFRAACCPQRLEQRMLPRVQGGPRGSARVLRQLVGQRRRRCSRGGDSRRGVRRLLRRRRPLGARGCCGRALRGWRSRRAARAGQRRDTAGR